MKLILKKAFLFTTICCSFLLSRSQEVKLGIIAGPNLNTIRLQDGTTKMLGSGTGYHAGAIARVQFSPNFAIQPQLMITSRGGKWSTTSDINTKLTGLDLPINFLYTEKNFFAGGGPSFRYGLSASFESEGVKINAYKPMDEAYLFKRFEIGASLVAGYKLNNGLFFSASFNPSITDISQAFEVKNNTVGLSVGFLF